jgi:hypothetical protein
MQIVEQAGKGREALVAAQAAMAERNAALVHLHEAAALRGGDADVERRLADIDKRLASIEEMMHELLERSGSVK